jgi:hypothetical protein
MNKRVHYLGLDVHKETIAVAIGKVSVNGIVIFSKSRIVFACRGFSDGKANGSNVRALPSPNERQSNAPSSSSRPAVAWPASL